MPGVLYGAYCSSHAQKWKCWLLSTAVDVKLSLCLILASVVGFSEDEEEKV